MKTIPRVLLRVVGALAALEVVYVLTAILLVQSGQVNRWLNKHPEKRRFSFDSAWTFIPGLVHLGGVRMVSDGRGAQLEVFVQKATAFVNPFGLFWKRVHVLDFRAQGVEFRHRKRPGTPEEATELETIVPPIEGARFEPYRGPRYDNRDKEEKKSHARGWVVDVRNASLHDVREIWIGGFRLRGHGTVDGVVLVETGGGTRLSIGRADVHYDGAELAVRNTLYTKELKLHADGRLEPFNTGETKGRAILGQVTGTVEMQARSTGELLNRYFGGPGWLRFTGEPRLLTGRLAVERGKIKPGGHLYYERGSTGAEFAGFIAEGQAAWHLQTVPARTGGGVDAEAKVDFSDYGMRRRAEGPPVMKGSGLLIEARSPADLQKMPPDDFEGQLQLGKAEFPDLTFVNALLPEGRRIVRSGRGAVDGGLRVGLGGACQGQVTIQTEDIVVQTGGVAIKGTVHVTVNVPRGDLTAQRFSLDDTRVAFADFGFKSQARDKPRPPWEGLLAVTTGDLRLNEKGKGVDARLHLRFSDTRPLVAFLSRDKPLAGWQERLLMIEKIKGEGVVEAAPGEATIHHFGVAGGKLDVRFRAAVGPEGAFGKAMVKYGVLKLGIGLVGNDRDPKYLRVGSWYKKEDIRHMPKLLARYAEKVDLEQEEGEAQEAEAAEAAQPELAVEKEETPPVPPPD